ncbi:threonine synthase [Anaeroselena agilis]|uniref:Threonine synthase n=1 Tax=Anaeroselena agilis TaxID=3063788 RepID=A0ABU3P261_9FIRM|nr:threonine synthase [Selenomonadales bacterium 4137-cl]
MSHVQGLECVTCGRGYSCREVEYYCPVCGYEDGILDVKYDYAAVGREINPAIMGACDERSMWRYLPLLPVENPALIPRPQVGWTPLYPAPRLARELKVAECYIKDEGRNPTASFKDRASAVGVVKALEKGAARITCASTGNAASSLAGFAAAAGLPATIFVPRQAPEAKKAQLMIYGAQVLAVEGTYDQAWELCMQASAEFGWYNRNCAVNPYLIEGKKTVSFELVEQFASLTGRPCPDWVAVSVGDGCTVGGVWKGLREMHRLGFMPKVPKILGVQAAGCQPFVTAWREGGSLCPVAADTIADSIAVGHPRNFRKGLRAVTASAGAFVAVSDDEIAWSMVALARKAAVFGEPAGVAGVAGVKKAAEQGIIAAGETVAIIVTGNGLKDTRSAIRAAGSPVAIEPSLEAVRSVVAGEGAHG